MLLAQIPPTLAAAKKHIPAVSFGKKIRLRPGFPNLIRYAGSEGGFYNLFAAIPW